MLEQADQNLSYTDLAASGTHRRLAPATTLELRRSVLVIQQAQVQATHSGPDQGFMAQVQGLGSGLMARSWLLPLLRLPCLWGRPLSHLSPAPKNPMLVNLSWHEGSYLCPFMALQGWRCWADAVAYIGPAPIQPTQICLMAYALWQICDSTGLASAQHHFRMAPLG